MLRVGLTGELGSGKSTVARLLAQHGATILSSDEMARAMMQPGQPVFQAIVDHFGPGVLHSDGHLDRPALARLAFDSEKPRVEELNAIIHPAVIADQEREIAEIARSQADAIVVIESALIFTTKHAGDAQPWRNRFDCIVLVTAPDDLKLARFVARVSNGRPLNESERLALLSDARARLNAQHMPELSLPRCLHLENAGDQNALQLAVDVLWQDLLALAAAREN